MKTVQFDDKILTEMNVDESEFAHEVKLGAAIAFYARHRLTLGQAAEMCGVSQYEFMRTLNDCGIASLDYPADDLRKETA